MLLLLPHSMDLTVTSQFPSQTITPFRTLSSVVLPSSRITLSLLITVSAPLLCPHFSTWLTVILCGPNPAAIWLSSSSVWIIQPWITQLCCFWVPSPPQIQRRSPHFTSVTHTYGFTVGLVFTLNISPPLKCEISLFHHNIVFSHIPFSVILTSTCVTWSAPPIFTFFSIQFSSLQLLSYQCPQMPRLILSLCPLAKPQVSPTLHFHEPMFSDQVDANCKFSFSHLTWTLRAVRRGEDCSWPNTAEPVVKASLILYLLLWVEEVLD